MSKLFAYRVSLCTVCHVRYDCFPSSSDLEDQFHTNPLASHVCCCFAIYLITFDLTYNTYDFFSNPTVSLKDVFFDNNWKSGMKFPMINEEIHTTFNFVVLNLCNVKRGLAAQHIY